MWDCEELERIRWNLKPPKAEVMAYDCSTGVFKKPIRHDFLNDLTYMKKEDTERMSVQKELSKAAENVKNEMKKEWDRRCVHKFCSVKSIEVSVDHRTVVVVWEDGDKTIVNRSEKDPDDIYMAFTAALAKKIYGSNSAVKRTINKKVNQHKPKIKKEVSE